MRLADKVAIVSGAASGMGAATARLFAREGAKVIVADVLEAEGKTVADSIKSNSGEARFQRLDVASDKVYQYNDGVGFVSGNRTADAFFNLDAAAGNTNPQGIADPPVSSAVGLATPQSRSSADSFESALLAVVGELESLLAGGKKRK